MAKILVNKDKGKRPKPRASAKKRPVAKKKSSATRSHSKASRVKKALARIQSDNSFTGDKYLEQDEIDYFINALNTDVYNAKGEKSRIKAERYRIYFLLLFYTGARCSEALDCHITDIKNGEIIIRGLKGSDTRTIPLPADFFVSLETYMNTYAPPKKGFLFNAYFSDRYARMRFKRYLPPGCNKTIHALRHTMGVYSYRKFKDIQLTRQILGHRDIRNTQIYMNYDAITHSKTKVKSIYKDS